MPTTLTAQANALIKNSGMSQDAQTALTTAAQSSSYFAGMLNAAAQNGGSIQMGVSGGGTALGLDPAHPHAIVIDPTWQPGSSSGEQSNVFASTVAHELGHFLFPGGQSSVPSSATPDQAATIGGNAEGIALTSEYIVALQLGLGTSTYMHSDQGQGLSAGTLTNQLNQAASQAGVNVSTLDYNSPIGNSFNGVGSPAVNAAANYTLDNLHPSIAVSSSNTSPISYREYYRDWQIFSDCTNTTDGSKVNPANVDWTRITSGSLKYSVDPATNTCTFTLQSVPLKNGGTATLNGTISSNGKPSAISESVDTNADGKADNSELYNVNPDGSVSDDVKTLTTSGATQNEEIIATNSAGQVAVNVSGQGATVTQNGASITLASGASATVNGNADTVIVGDFADATILGADTVVAGRGDDISTYSDNTHVIIHGDSTRVYNYGANDTTIMSAGNDISVNHGYNDITNSYGPADDTYDYGYDERDHNFGPNDFGWAANASDIVYNANPSDTSAGYGDIRVHGNARVPGDGYYGYYGFAGNSAANDATHGSNIGSLAQFDRVHGKSGEAAVAQRAKSEIDDAIAHDAKVMLSGAKWEKNTVTWSVGDGGDFSGSMSPSEVQAVKQAFADWSAATGLNFVEVASSGTADITVGMGSFDTSNTGVIGFTTFRATGGEIQPGAVVRVEDVSEDPLVSGADGTSVYGGTDATFSQALLHEIGHALGFGDNADPTSVESYYLSAANRTLSSHDIAQAAALYGGGSAAVHDAHQIIQAMSSFAPAPMVSSVAANDPSVSVNAVLYGGNQLMQRANAN